MVGTTDAPASDVRNLQILFGLVLAITARSSKSKDELPATRIHRQCNPRAIEVAFLSGSAIDFFAQEQLLVLQDWYPIVLCLWPEPGTHGCYRQGGRGSTLPGTFFVEFVTLMGLQLGIGATSIH